MSASRHNLSADDYQSLLDELDVNDLNESTPEEIQTALEDLNLMKNQAAAPSFAKSIPRLGLIRDAGPAPTRTRPGYRMEPLGPGKLGEGRRKPVEKATPIDIGEKASFNFGANRKMAPPRPERKERKPSNEFSGQKWR